MIGEHYATEKPEKCARRGKKRENWKRKRKNGNLNREWKEKKRQKKFIIASERKLHQPKKNPGDTILFSAQFSSNIEWNWMIKVHTERDKIKKNCDTKGALARALHQQIFITTKCDWRKQRATIAGRSNCAPHLRLIWASHSTIPRIELSMWERQKRIVMVSGGLCLVWIDMKKMFSWFA